MATKKNGVTIIKPTDLADISDSLKLLAGVEVLVGFPDDTADRGGEDDGPITNAALGYIHDNGAPEANIPARPFMAPGIANAQDKLTDKLGQVLRKVVRGQGGAELVEAGLMQVGLIAQSSIQAAIGDGPPPPLADSTLRARRRKGSKGAADELNAREYGMTIVGAGGVKALNATGQMKKAVSFAIRERNKRT